MQQGAAPVLRRCLLRRMERRAEVPMRRRHPKTGDGQECLSLVNRDCFLLIFAGQSFIDLIIAVHHKSDSAILV